MSFVYVFIAKVVEQMEPIVESFIGHVITSISVGWQRGLLYCLYLGGFYFTETVTSMTNLSNLRFQFSKAVYLWLLVLVLNFSPRLSLHFLQVPLVGMILISCCC